MKNKYIKLFYLYFFLNKLKLLLNIAIYFSENIFEILDLRR